MLAPSFGWSTFGHLDPILVNVQVVCQIKHVLTKSFKVFSSNFLIVSIDLVVGDQLSVKPFVAIYALFCKQGFQVPVKKVRFSQVHLHFCLFAFLPQQGIEKYQNIKIQLQ